MAEDEGNAEMSSNTPTNQVRVNDEVDTTKGSGLTPPSNPPAPHPDDRNNLLQRARIFLRSPNVVHEDANTKRQFLIEKGLRQDEIDALMRELPLQLPSIPPRTYPQPPPSNLPRLLLGLTKILTYLTGGSAILILIYYRFLLPRITHSSLARRALKQHQVSLLKRLNTSLTELKSTQTETRSVLPSPRISYEPAELAHIHSLEQLGIGQDDEITLPAFTLLRCAIEGLAADEKKVTKEELFAFLEDRYAWLKSDEGLAYQNSLWETLTTNPCFSEVKENGKLVLTYTAPTPPEPTRLLTSLETLKSSLPLPRKQTRSEASPSPFQRTLDVLTEFTGYITTQTYQLTTSMGLRTHGYGFSTFGSPSTVSAQLTPQQEEIRKEIRALKGLVLNRRAFAPTPVRPTPASSTA